MSTTALTVNKSSMALPVVTDDLNSYLSKIAHIDLLTVDEEQTLARRLREDEDLDAARRLVMSQLRFVVHIARTYKGYGLPMSDLVQGRQHRPDEGRQALRPGRRRPADLVRRPLDPGRDPRVRHPELAHRQGRHDERPRESSSSSSGARRRR